MVVYVRYAVVCCLALVLVTAPAGEAKQRGHKPKQAACSLSGSKTVMATTEARLFTKVDRRRGTLSEYACLYSRNRRFLLSVSDTAPGGSGDTTGLPVLAGPYVAYVLGHFDDSERYNPEFKGFPDQVVAINLSTAADLRFPAAAGSSPAAKVSDLVLSASGSFAWIGSGSAGNEVHRLDVGDAADTVVDSGAGVQPDLLALARSTIYWLNRQAGLSADQVALRLALGPSSRSGSFSGYLWLGSSYGPRKRSPLKWIRWLGLSAHHTSVSEAISATYLRISARDVKHETYTRPARLSAKRFFDSE